MRRWFPRSTQSLARRALALFGVFGALGVFGAIGPVSSAPAAAATLPERTALEARVAEMRRHLHAAAKPGPGTAADAPTLIAQSGRWNNWPNWSNWANWRNG